MLHDFLSEVGLTQTQRLDANLPGSPIEAAKTFDGRLARLTQEIIVKNIMKRFAADESGATAIEYGLIAAIMGVAVIGVFRIFGSKLTTGFSAVGDGFVTNAKSVK